MPTDTYHNLPDEKREFILDAALSEFADHAYEAASISNIARQAKIAKSNLYQCFEGKNDLYYTLIEYESELRLTLLQALPSPNPNGDLFSYLRWLFLSEVYLELKHPKLAHLAHRASLEKIPLPDMTKELRRRGTTQFFKQLLTQGILHGTIAPTVDPNAAAFLLETTYYQVGRYIINRLQLTPADVDAESIAENEDIQQILDNLMDLLTEGMQARNQE